jgi:hypothetical protein
VYAWFFPLRLYENPEELLRFARALFAYDCKKQDWTVETEALDFTWEPMKVTVTRQWSPKKSTTRVKHWETIKGTGDPAIRVFTQALLMGSIFAKPLYVGLAKNLSRRYGEHIEGKGETNTFHKRFEGFIDLAYKNALIQQKISIKQLVFACIPLVGEQGEKPPVSAEQIALLEDLLKRLCQPVFGER